MTDTRRDPEEQMAEAEYRDYADLAAYRTPTPGAHPMTTTPPEATAAGIEVMSQYIDRLRATNALLLGALKNLTDAVAGGWTVDGAVTSETEIEAATDVLDRAEVVARAAIAHAEGGAQ